MLGWKSSFCWLSLRYRPIYDAYWWPQFNFIAIAIGQERKSADMLPGYAEKFLQIYGNCGAVKLAAIFINFRLQLRSKAICWYSGAVFTTIDAGAKRRLVHEQLHFMLLWLHCDGNKTLMGQQTEDRKFLSFEREGKKITGDLARRHFSPENVCNNVPGHFHAGEIVIKRVRGSLSCRLPWWTVKVGAWRSSI